MDEVREVRDALLDLLLAEQAEQGAINGQAGQVQLVVLLQGARQPLLDLERCPCGRVWKYTRRGLF